MKRIALVSLGCEKNLVDSEMILGMLKKTEVEIVDKMENADIIIINTCGFITSAKEEAINTIFDALDFKKEGKKIIVCGCLVERYLEELKKEIKEVDEWIPIKDYYRFGDIIKKYLRDDSLAKEYLKMDSRLISTPAHMAYVRIADGCLHRCAYCAIPLIRGKLKSRSEEEIVEEVQKYANEGRSEICLISQDTSAYGYDIKTNLTSLLKKLIKIKGVKWFRLLYLYPSEIKDDLIQLIKENDKIIPYFDIPLQHASDKILKYMRRVGDLASIKDLLTKIKKEIPSAILRTTMMVGFPHESEKDFNILLDFINEYKFNHLGAFTYSKEEDTLSYDMTGQVSEKIKKERLNILMDKQRWISFALNREMINKTYDCVIEKYDEEEDKFYGRTYAFAPDDIDGMVIIDNKGKFKQDIISSFKKVKIVDADFYDLKAEWE